MKSFSIFYILVSKSSSCKTTLAFSTIIILKLPCTHLYLFGPTQFPPSKLYLYFFNFKKKIVFFFCNLFFLHLFSHLFPKQNKKSHRQYPFTTPFNCPLTMVRYIYYLLIHFHHWSNLVLPQKQLFSPNTIPPFQILSSPAPHLSHFPHRQVLLLLPHFMMIVHIRS